MGLVGEVPVREAQKSLLSRKQILQDLRSMLGGATITDQSNVSMSTASLNASNSNLHNLHNHHHTRNTFTLLNQS